MANELLRSKHAFGSSYNLDKVVSEGKVDAYDILFLDGDTDHPKIGWLDKNGKVVLVRDEKADLTEVEADIDNLESGLSDLGMAMDKKADADEVNAKIGESVTEAVDSANAYTDKKFEAAIAEHLTEKYEICDVPEGTLVKIDDREIRIMCPHDAVFSKQNVGTGGDPNCYYAAFKTYVPNDSVVGYIERLGNQVDSEIQKTFSVDEYGRKYQTTWLALARYDDSTGVWNYYGKNSEVNRYIGWDYQIDFYNDSNEIVGSDTVRISLSNESCHFVNEPYYVGSIMKEVNAKIEEKIAEVESAWQIVEF